MIKTLTKHGNSLALVIDRPILDLLKIDANTPLEITTDGRKLTLAPAKDAERAKKVESLLEDINARYGRALKNLAS
jgi:antitoxin MazE